MTKESPDLWSGPREWSVGFLMLCGIEIFPAVGTAIRASDFTQDAITLLKPTIMVHHEPVMSVTSIVKLFAHAISWIAGSQRISEVRIRSTDRHCRQ